MRRVIRAAVARVDELPPGSRRLVEIAQRPIGVFNVNGEYVAVLNRCPHKGGPLCRGSVSGLSRAVPVEGEAPAVTWEREGEILRCPWHAWEFDLLTGEAVIGDRWRVPLYRTEVGQPGESDNTAVAGELPKLETFPTDVKADVVYVEVPV